MIPELVTSACCLPALTRVELFDAAKYCGFDQVELFSAGHKSKFGESETRDTVRGNGVSISAIHLPFELDAARRLIDLAVPLDIRHFIVHGKEKPADAAQWLKPLVVHAEKLGADVVLTNHKGQSIDSADDVAAALDACGDHPPFVLFEAGQYWASGHDSFAAFKRFEARVRRIHIKDLNKDGKSVPYGEGVSPLAEFLGVVAASSFRGPLVVEVEYREPPIAEQIEILKTARAKTIEWLKVAEAVGGGRDY